MRKIKFVRNKYYTSIKDPYTDITNKNTAPNNESGIKCQVQYLSDNFNTPNVHDNLDIAPQINNTVNLYSRKINF